MDDYSSVLQQPLLISGDSGIRTHVPVARQLDFESSSLWPLRYVSIKRTVIVYHKQRKFANRKGRGEGIKRH